MKKNRNKGFSLIELIVTIAIMVILSTGAFYAISSVTGFRAKQAGEFLYQSVQQTKVDAMSKGGQNYMKVYVDGDVYYAERHAGSQTEKKELGKEKQITITYTCVGGTTEKTVTASNPLILSFQKASGAFEPLLQENPGGSLTKSTEYCSSIFVRTKSGNRTKEIVCYPDTGKCDYHER